MSEFNQKEYQDISQSEIIRQAMTETIEKAKKERGIKSSL